MNYSISDFEKISKMSWILVVPLMSAALYAEFGWWAIGQDDYFFKYINSNNYFIASVSKAIGLAFSVFIILLMYSFIEVITANSKPFRFVMALTLITYGILGMGTGVELIVSLIAEENATASNFYMYLAGLAWGFDILNTDRLISKIETD